MSVYVYDVTNSVLITPAAVSLPNNIGTFTTSFGLTAGTSYRLILHVASTNASAYTLKVDNVSVGYKQTPQGAVIEEPKSVTVTGSWSSNTTYAAFVTRRGSYAKFKISVETSGAPTSANLSVILPSGYTIDTTKLPGTLASVRTPLGIAYCSDSASVTYPGQVNYLSTTSVALFTQFVKTDDAGSANDPVKEWEINQAVPFTFGAGDSVQMEFEVPIAEWAGSGTVNLAQNDVEYASNSSTATTGDDTTSFAYGPAGNLIRSITALLDRSVKFSNIQDGDSFIVEFNAGSGWLPTGSFGGVDIGFTNQNSVSYGFGIDDINKTTGIVRVRFGTYAFNTSTYGAVGTAWSVGVGAYYWRVRKTSAGAAVGFGIVSANSSGLMPASNSNLDDATATRLGLKQYVHGTTYNNAVTVSVTSVDSFTVTRGVFIPHQCQDGTWRMRFSLTATTASGASTHVLTFASSQVVFKTGYNQDVSVSGVSSASTYLLAYTNSGASTITQDSNIGHGTIRLSGDVELDSKPTWAY